MNRFSLMIPPLPWHRPRHRNGEGERVILIHGLWRSVWAMESTSRFLNKRGFETLNVPYPSFRKSLDEIVDLIGEAIGPSNKPTHFVTHSMGGIVLRCLAERYPELVTGKTVMLAPPNQGSEIIDWLEDSPLGRLSLGPGGMSLSTANVSQNLPGLPPGRETYVIMGKRDRTRIFRSMFDGANDGVVTVAGGRLPGVTHLDVVDADHTFIMGEDEVLEKVARYLQ